MRYGLAAWLFILTPSVAFAGDRVTLNFNPDWRFIKADPNGAQQPVFDDSNWTTVSAPHTYNDIDTFDDWSIAGHHGESNQWSGRTWYRKTFTPPASIQGKKVYIEFEAVRQVAEVYLNGRLLGVSKTGFTPFGFDLTPYLKPGQPNVLVVMCDNRFQQDGQTRARAAATSSSANPTGSPDTGPPTGPGSIAAVAAEFSRTIPETVEELQAYQIPWNNPHWHPAHGGIYRNVRLYVVDPLHISLPLYSFLQTEGPYVYATDITANSAKIGIEVPVENSRAMAAQASVAAEIIDPDGKPVASVTTDGLDIPAGKQAMIQANIVIANPKLWEPSYPYLYQVKLALKVGGETVDTAQIPLGIRTVKWTVDQGFFINGHHLKLHGWGQKPTDEWPGLGAAQPDWMHYFTLNLMKQAGGNFVRWGHCAAGPAGIDACDRLGIIVDQPGVDGESDTVRAAWTLRTQAFRDTLMYFRNNPSILVWEGGNQKVTREHAAELHSLFDKYDPHGGRAYTHRRPDAIDAEFMDVQIGTEGGRELRGDRNMPVFEGEYNREESPRRVWDAATPRHVGGDPTTPEVFGYVEGKGDYVLTSEQYAVNQVQQYVGKLGAPDHSGGGNWIFSDSTSGGRVTSEVARAGGEVDGVRLPKEAYYVCRTMFRRDPQVCIIGHWNYRPGTQKTVYVASNCDQVELLVNGKSVGRMGPGEAKGSSLRYLFTFPDVVWSPGEVKAVAYKGDKPVAEQVKKTVGAPAALKLTAITGPDGLLANGSDVVLIDIEAVDADGQRCPTFEQRVDFTTEGPSVWRGGYNSGIINSINNAYLNLECGINRVAIRSTLKPGTITVSARTDRLKPATIKVESKPFQITNGYAAVLPAVPTYELPAGPVDDDTMPVSRSAVQDRSPSARFVQSFSYSGPTKGTQVQTGTADGKPVYADAPAVFENLPPSLRGADYILAPNADKLYSAVDLMEVAVKAGTVVSVAFDDQLARPDWLTRQFKPTERSLTIQGRKMTIFQQQAANDESLTLGSNAEDRNAMACNMYIVFVNAPSAGQ